MKAFLQKLCSTKLFPLSWTFFIIILLCLPGSIVPGSGIFGIPGLDKVVHIILFGSLVLFWSLYMQQHNKPGIKWVLEIVFLSIALGVLLEYVQFYLIPFRSFDKNDIIADVAGCLLALVALLLLRNKKTKPL